jgi:hypothetical protein
MNNGVIGQIEVSRSDVVLADGRDRRRCLSGGRRRSS